MLSVVTEKIEKIFHNKVGDYIETVSQLLKSTGTWMILINEQDVSEGSDGAKPQRTIPCLYSNGYLQHLSGLQNHNEPVTAVYLPLEIRGSFTVILSLSCICCVCEEQILF